MADEEGQSGGGGGGDSASMDPPVKCPECKPGLPGWMATFSDLVTLLLTFFVLLLSFAKTETAKYEAALGSIRDAFGGNVLKHGEVIQRGKSPDDFPTMLESQQPIKPFPIEFLTMEGILDKYEINRESDEELVDMKKDLRDNDLSEDVAIYEQPEGIKVVVKEKIFFKEGSVEIDGNRISVEVYDRLIKLLKKGNWTVFVQGHASRGEISSDGKADAFMLSSARAGAVSRSLIRRGVRPEMISTVYYGDTRPISIPGMNFAQNQAEGRRVEFMVRKSDLGTLGHKVESK